MRKIILLILLSVSVNLALLSVGHTQSSVGVSGYVPETELNRNSAKGQIILDENRPVFKENKYLYYFEKMLGLETKKNKTGAEPSQAQTQYDQIASSFLMLGLMMIFAIIFWLIIKVIDIFIQKLNKFYSKIVKKRLKTAGI